MPVSSKSALDKTLLRAEAAFRLKIGVANGAGWTLGADTLGLLFRLASSSDTVMDGLKLLHELQTHQIELEMQHQEIERSSQLHSMQMNTYKLLFEHATFGYVVVQSDGRIVDSNLAAARILAVMPKACNGMFFENFFTALSAYGIKDLLKYAVVQGPATICVLELEPFEGRPKRVQLLISRSPEGGQFFIGMSNYDQLLKV